MSLRAGVNPLSIKEAYESIVTKQKSKQLQTDCFVRISLNPSSLIGTFLKRKGKVVANCLSNVFIEEILYLTERGTAEIIEENSNLRLSVRHIYELLLNGVLGSYHDDADDIIQFDDESVLNHYLTYCHLRRSGYTVHRDLTEYRKRPEKEGSPWADPWKVSDCRGFEGYVAVHCNRESLKDLRKDLRHFSLVDRGEVVFLEIKRSNAPPMSQ